MKNFVEFVFNCNLTDLNQECPSHPQQTGVRRRNVRNIVYQDRAADLPDDRPAPAGKHDLSPAAAPHFLQQDLDTDLQLQVNTTFLSENTKILYTILRPIIKEEEKIV